MCEGTSSLKQKWNKNAQNSFKMPIVHIYKDYEVKIQKTADIEGVERLLGKHLCMETTKMHKMVSKCQSIHYKMTIDVK